MDMFRAPAHNRHDHSEAAEPLPPVIGQDERRMQLRAYRYWNDLLGTRAFPCISALHAQPEPDLAPNAVLLDFTTGDATGAESPRIALLGAALAAECAGPECADPESDGTIAFSRLSDVPGRSLLSRITGQYREIMARKAPVGFEAEFVNRQGRAVLYRGILLPFSSDNRTIDYIYGVISWKELADEVTDRCLQRELGQALDAGPDTVRHRASALLAMPKAASRPQSLEPSMAALVPGLMSGQICNIGGRRRYQR